MALVVTPASATANRELSRMAVSVTPAIRERFESKLSFEPMSGCWLWIGASDRLGYGQFKVGGSTQKSHRVSWVMANGRIPEGYEIDHVCMNRACSNPEHMRLATRSENTRNSGLRKSNTSGLKGAFWHKDNKRWFSCIRVEGKLVHLGYADSPEAAHEKYCEAALRLHGKFANTGGAL